MRFSKPRHRFGTGERILQSSHVNHKPVPHVAFEHARVGSGDVFDVDQLDVGYDVVLGTEIKHFLRFGYATDAGTCHTAAAGQQREWLHRIGLGGHTYVDQRSVRAKKR